MNAVDTNVLIYAADPRDPAKQAIAEAMIRDLESPALVWQVAAEYLAASRKLEGMGVTRAASWAQIERLHQTWSVIYPTWATIVGAQDLLTRFSLSTWDAMLVASCAAGGVKRLYTEDFSAYPSIAGVEIVNPFGR